MQENGFKKKNGTKSEFVQRKQVSGSFKEVTGNSFELNEQITTQLEFKGWKG